MIEIAINRPIKTIVLIADLAAAFPAWNAPDEDAYPYKFRINSKTLESGEWGNVLMVPDEADLPAVQAVIDAHDAAAPSQPELQEQKETAAQTEFKQLPTWATVTPAAGRDYVTQQVFNGQTEAEVSAWIDTNVNTLAQAKTALKQSAAAIIALRDMEARLAQALLYLRDLIIK